MLFSFVDHSWDLSAYLREIRAEFQDRATCPLLSELSARVLNSVFILLSFQIPKYKLVTHCHNRKYNKVVLSHPGIYLVFREYASIIKIKYLLPLVSIEGKNVYGLNLIRSIS
jgi:hypothetical protein